MDFLFTGLFWGVVLILLGVSLILKWVLGIDIPVFRIVMALVLIYLGVRMLIGTAPSRVDGNRALFAEAEFSGGEADRDYTVVFGRGNLDLRAAQVTDKDVAVDFSTVFGSGVIHLRKDVPARVKVTSAFGGARLPDGNQVAFGETTWRNAAYKEGAPALVVEAHVVFGGLEVVEE